MALEGQPDGGRSSMVGGSRLVLLLVLIWSQVTFGDLGVMT